MPEWSVFAPIVLERGSTYLDISIEPILKSIESFIKTHPHAPIILLGTSNGGRVVLELSNRLSSNNPILVISLAGAIGGSGLLSLGENLHVAKYLVQACVREELAIGSQRISKLLSDARRRAQQGKINYIFIGASFDHLLVQSSLAFPNLQTDASKNILMPDVGHSAIVTKSLPLVKPQVKQWLERLNNKVKVTSSM